MESESKIVLAFLFKRSGKNMLKESDIYLPLSLELGWFSSTQAQEFVKHALNEKLLIKKENHLYRPLGWLPAPWQVQPD